MATNKIGRDHSRFKQIVRGKIKKELRRYITQGELIGRQGKKAVSIPLPQIQLPKFRYGSQEKGGVGQGDGEEGDPLGKGEPQPGEAGEAGESPGEHVLEVDIDIDELAEILGEELSLPRIEPKGKKAIAAEKDVYTGIHRQGPESLRHFKRTFKAALLREVASGTYDPDNPIVLPRREDKRYRSWKTQRTPEANAVIIYMMDVSGSMGHEQKEMVRIESFWIDTWLRSQYKNIESRFIVHDAAAKEVDRHTFFHLRESGGTKISSAYELALRMIDDEFPSEEWNIYPFHFSDGDNWGGDDTRHCVELLDQQLLPKSNVFCYGQVKSAYGSGQFIKDLRAAFPEEDERIILSSIASRDEIYDSIKDFLGSGK